MMVRTCLSALALASLLLFGASPAAAEEKVIEGVVIVKVADGKLFIKKDGNEHTAELSKDVKITVDGKDKKADDLKADMKCKLTVDKGNGSVTVLKVEVQTTSK